MKIYRLVEHNITKTKEYQKTRSDSDIFSLLQSKRFTSELSALECILDVVYQTIDTFGDGSEQVLYALRNIVEKAKFDPIIFNVARNLENSTTKTNIMSCLGNKQYEARWTVVEEETDEFLQKEELLQVTLSTSPINSPPSKMEQVVNLLREEGVFVSEIQNEIPNNYQNTLTNFLNPQKYYNPRNPSYVRCLLTFSNPEKSTEFYYSVIKR